MRSYAGHNLGCYGTHLESQLCSRLRAEDCKLEISMGNSDLASKAKTRDWERTSRRGVLG